MAKETTIKTTSISYQGAQVEFPREALCRGSPTTNNTTCDKDNMPIQAEKAHVHSLEQE